MQYMSGRVASAGVWGRRASRPCNGEMADDWSTLSMECPRCHSANDHHVIWGPRNLVICLLNALNAVWLLGWWPFVNWKRATTPRSALLRKCLKCGYVHEGKEAPKECPSCKHPQGYYTPLCEDF